MKVLSSEGLTKLIQLIKGSFISSSNTVQTTTTTLPTDTSDLTNGAGFITSSALSGYEQTSNRVTSITSSSTNSEYPTAKAVYDFASGSTGCIGFIDFSNGISLATGVAYTMTDDGWITSTGSVRLDTNVGKQIIGGGSVCWVPITKGTTIYVSGIPATFYPFL